MNRIQGSLFLGGLIGVMLIVLSTFAAPPSSLAQQPRPTLTPTPEITSPPNEPPEESPPGSQPAETAPSPQTLPSTGPSLLPVTGYGLTAIGVGFGMAAAALAARRARRRRQTGNPEHPQEP